MLKKKKSLFLWVASLLSLSVAGCTASPSIGDSTDSCDSLDNDASKKAQEGWPSQQIKEVVGDGVPAFSGKYFSISVYTGEQAEKVKQLVINMMIVSQSDYNAYLQTLLSAGFTGENFGYTKRVGNNRLTISPSFYEGNPMIVITLEIDFFK